MMNAKTRVKLLAIVGSVVALVAAGVAGKALTADVRPVRPGSKAPDFRAVNLATGDTVSLRDYDGDVILLNIWATWCAPCEVEMPSMQRLHELLGPSGLKIVAISIDAEESEFVTRWAEERGLTFDILHDQRGTIAVDYQATGQPESYVIDRDGVIVRKVWGAVEWDEPVESAVIRRLLGLPDPNGEG
jgi:cytochrome c biogenesis protein CcmG, thiol:disulfide interchange protein DsbE